MPQVHAGGPSTTARFRFRSKEAAAGVSSLLAGTAYLLAQLLASGAVRDEGFLAPLQRIAAMLLGPDAALRPGEVSVAVVVMGTLIHFPLALIFGRLIAGLVDRFSGWKAIGCGLLMGIALYGLNFWIIAPSAFPWFRVSGGTITLVDHALFGALVSALYVQLRPATT
jgi:type IV secretory pathway VirB2 component (pilin)